MKIIFRKKETILLILLFPFFLYSQVRYGNEWIVYGQEYAKISVNKNGIYKISKLDLDKIGFNSIGKNPKNLQMFFRGKEIAINIYGEEDNKFDNEDFIEFYAIKNDGKQDEEVYRPKSARPHPYVSLFSDQTTYFITFSKDLLGKRASKEPQIDNEIIPEPYYMATDLNVFDEVWNWDANGGFSPNLIQSYYEPNEGLSSKVFRNDLTGDFKAFTKNIILENYEPNYYNEKDQIQFEVLINSRYSANKNIGIITGEKTGEVSLSDFNSKLFKTVISKITNQTLPVNIEITKTQSSIEITPGKKMDRFGLFYYRINYPSKPIFVNNKEYTLRSEAKDISHILLKNVKNKIIGFDITDFANQKKITIKQYLDSSLASIYVKNTEENSKIFLSNDYSLPKSIEKVVFANKLKTGYDYFIITNSSLLESANEYKNYRESNQGGNFKVLLAETKKLFDEFSYGERSPIAIRRFIDFMYTIENPKYLFLIGNSSSLPSNLKTTEDIDFVPTFGYPGSDILLTEGLNGKKINVASIPTGRISALTNAQVHGYLDKIKEYENEKLNSFWKKSFLQLSGGKVDSEVRDFSKLLNNLGQIASNGAAGINYNLIAKSNVNNPVENIDISEQINKGIGLLTFCGHSNYATTDLNIGFVSDLNSNYNNKGKYPFMFFNGCGAGNIFSNRTSLTNDWILTPEKGAIGILAASYVSYFNTSSIYMTKLYNTWFKDKSNINTSIGQIVQMVNEKIISENPNDLYLIAEVTQMILQGDPAIKLFNFTKPDYEINNENLFLSSVNTGKLISESDSLNLGIFLSNFGYYESTNRFSLKLVKNFIDGTSENKNYEVNGFGYLDTLVVKIKKDVKLKSITVELDSNNKIDELSENNNIALINLNWELLNSKSFYSFSSQIDNLNPLITVKFNNELPFDEIETFTNPNLSIKLVDDNIFKDKKNKLIVSIIKLCDNCTEKTKPIIIKEVSGGLNEIIVDLNLGQLEVGRYQVFIQGFDEKNNSSGNVFNFVFKVVEENINEKLFVKVHPNPLVLYTQFEVSNLNSNTNNKYSLIIFDIQGKECMKLNSFLSVNEKNIFWDGKNSFGNKLSSGLYFYQLIINELDIFNGKILLK